MSLRKSVSFSDDSEISVFFSNQPPNLVLESYNEPLKTRKTEPMVPVPAHCSAYTLENSDSDIEPENQVPNFLTFITMSEISTLNTHFLLYIDLPGEPVSSLIDSLQNFFPIHELETITVVKPLKKTHSDNDFNIGYEGIMIGITLKSTDDSKKYITNEREIVISPQITAKLIPGSRGEHIWAKYVIEKNFLQGFFFVGKDMVDFFPEKLCYLVSFPKGYSREMILKEIYSHAKESPVHMIYNHLEAKFVVRLEFEKEETVRFLLRRCMNFDGKPVLVLPCVDRTPVDLVYQKNIVCVSGYNNAINPKGFIRLLNEYFGPVAELNINYEGLESFVLFQNASAAENCLKKKEIVEKNSRIKFCKPNKTLRLTGLRWRKGKFNYNTPARPLPVIPANYTFDEEKIGNSHRKI